MPQAWVKWSPEEIARLHELAGTMSPQAIGNLLGRKTSGVYCKMQDLDLTWKKRHKWDVESMDQLRSLAGTMSAAKIAVLLGCSAHAVISRMHEHGMRGLCPRTAPPEVARYMERYGVSWGAVEYCTVERLDAMGEEARAFLLHSNARRKRDRLRSRRPIKAVPTIATMAVRKPTDTARVERMMALARRAA